MFYSGFVQNLYEKVYAKTVYTVSCTKVFVELNNIFKWRLVIAIKDFVKNSLLLKMCKERKKVLK